MTKCVFLKTKAPVPVERKIVRGCSYSHRRYAGTRTARPDFMLDVIMPR